jgi:hypothetical protein
MRCHRRSSAALALRRRPAVIVEREDRGADEVGDVRSGPRTSEFRLSVGHVVQSHPLRVMTGFPEPAKVEYDSERMKEVDEQRSISSIQWYDPSGRSDGSVATSGGCCAGGSSHAWVGPSHAVSHTALGALGAPGRAPRQAPHDCRGRRRSRAGLLCVGDRPPARLDHPTTTSRSRWERRPARAIRDPRSAYEHQPDRWRARC